MLDSFTLLHNDLAQEAAWGLSSLYESWKRDGRIDPFLIIWPSKTTQFNSETVNDTIPLQLPAEREKWGEFIAQAAKDTAAWALMLTEQRTQSIVVILESPVGTKSWHFPIQKIGATEALGAPVECTDTDYIGVRWRP